MLKHLGKAINTSASLLSIHLSGNPGVRDEPVKKLAAIISATHEKQLAYKTFDQFLCDKMKKETQPINYANMFHLKHLQQEKMTEMPFEDGILSNKIDRNLIFTR